MAGWSPIAARVVLLAVLGVAGFGLTWSDQLADLGGDSAIYVMTAQHFAPYLDAGPVAATFAEASLFPPLYPLLLALTGGAADLHLAHAVTTACLLLALWVLDANLRALGLTPRLALAGVAAFALMPETLTRVLQVRSECLYLALSLAGFAWLSRGSASTRARDCWLATGCFALALLTRSAGIVLLPALVVALLRLRPRRGWAMPLAMLAPALLWAAQRSEQTYGVALLDVLRAPLGSIIDLLQFNLTAFTWGLAGNLLQTQALLPALLPLALVAAVVLGRRLARGEPDAWYLAGYVAMMALWPYPTEAQRFGWVVMPWLLGYALLGLQQLAARIALAGAARALRWFAPAVLAIMLLPGAALATLRFFEPEQRALARLPEWYLADREGALVRAEAHLATAEAMAELGGRVPEAACLFSVTPTTAFYSGRLNVLPAEEQADDAAFEAWLERWGCRYFLLLAATDGTITRTEFYPRQRLGARLLVADVRYVERSGRPVAALAILRE